ncbi:MAG: LysR family transcriptional regulator [Myxococcota bacterium]
MLWDDLRYILAVARHGTLSDGAKALRVNVTTVSRRLRAMEQEAGSALFEKLKHGAVLTGAGEEMVAVAEAVEKLTLDLDARIKGLDTKLEGTIRVTSTDLLLRQWLPDFGEFQRQFPDVQLELVSRDTITNLTQREADVAIRIAMRAPEHLIGRKHAQVSFATYGSRGLVDSIGADAPYSAFPWLAWDLASSRRVDDFLAEHAPGAKVVTRLAQMPIMVQAVAAGLGLCILPCVAADNHPDLRRVGDFSERGAYVWVLTHPGLRGSARVRRFVKFMSGVLERDKDLLEGRRPAV